MRIGPPAEGPGWPAGLLFTVGCGVVGLVVGRWLRLPVAALLGPVLLAAVVDLSGLGHGAQVPAAVRVAAFLVIGLQVGLSFTRESLATIGRALPLALARDPRADRRRSAGLGRGARRRDRRERARRLPRHHPGRALRRPRHRDRQRRRRHFVLAVQVLRLFVMLLSAPLVARVLRRSGGDLRAGRAPTLAGRDSSEEEARCPTTPRPETQTSTEDAVLLFIGGPLDGRVEIRAARHGEPLPTVTHVHLHDGPKVVHRYDLEPLDRRRRHLQPAPAGPQARPRPGGLRSHCLWTN